LLQGGSRRNEILSFLIAISANRITFLRFRFTIALKHAGIGHVERITPKICGVVTTSFELFRFALPESLGSEGIQRNQR
jgi:hypothetical protein